MQGFENDDTMDQGAAHAPRQGLEGQVLAQKYELLRLLGQGGMGAVYEGRNLSTLKRCAVKLLLSPELAANPSVVKRFFREARASSVIESDHIVQIYDSGSDPATGYPYMVMELLQGQDLEATIEQLGALPPITVTKILLQAAVGLAKAHEAGIVHRDIKPANLFITRRDSGDLIVKVLDFGIAKVKMEQFRETSQGLTRTGALLGTPLYMSPEQALGDSDIDARSDVWSLGVVMYQLLTGHVPFGSSRSLGELMVSIIKEDVPLIQERAPWVAPELAEIVHRAMSRELSHRFRNAGELRAALGELSPEGAQLTPDMLVALPTEYRSHVAPRLVLTDDGLLRATTRGGLLVSQDVRPAAQSKRSWLTIGAIAGVVAVGAGALALNVRRSDSPAPAARETLAPAATPTSTGASMLLSYPLLVGPDGVEVSVEGRSQPVKDGRIELSGAPGETRRVKLSFKNDSMEETVAITTTGLVPRSLELARKAAATSPTTKQVKPSQPSAKDAGVPAKQPAKASPQVEHDLKEFGE